MLLQLKISSINYKFIVSYLSFSILFTAIFSYIGYFIFKEPAEDALILFCFSENLANTGVISYYPGGPPAEGATDFLWMILLALLYKLGLPTFFATHLISSFSLTGILYFINKLHKHVYQESMSYIEFLAISCLFIFGSLYVYAVIAGFSVYFFGVAIAATVYYFLTNNSKKFAIAGFLLCLVRPGGFILATPLAIFLIFDKSLNRTKTVKHLCLYAIIPGVLYFIVRWKYFGELLPLPWYVKSGWEFRRFDFLGFRSLITFRIVESIFSICGSLILIAFLSLITNNKFKIKLKKFNFTNQQIKIIYLLIAIIIICLFYSRIVLEQNIGNRFFILFTLPILMLFIYFKQITEVFNKKYCFTLASIFTIFNANSINEHYSEIINNTTTDIRFYLGKELYKIKNKGKIFTTEAGAIAYYSKWETYDSWGLSTKDFAKHIFQPEDLQYYNPDIIFSNVNSKIVNQLRSNITLECFNKYHPQVVSNRNWHNMCINLAIASYMYGYELWYDNRTYLIALKSDSKLYEQIKQIFIKLGITKID